jgi:hypothetical protein
MPVEADQREISGRAVEASLNRGLTSGAHARLITLTRCAALLGNGPSHGEQQEGCEQENFRYTYLLRNLELFLFFG